MFPSGIYDYHDHRSAERDSARANIPTMRPYISTLLSLLLISTLALLAQARPVIDTNSAIKFNVKRSPQPTPTPAPRVLSLNPRSTPDEIYEFYSPRHLERTMPLQSSDKTSHQSPSPPSVHHPSPLPSPPVPSVNPTTPPSHPVWAQPQYSPMPPTSSTTPSLPQRHQMRLYRHLPIRLPAMCRLLPKHRSVLLPRYGRERYGSSKYCDEYQKHLWSRIGTVGWCGECKWKRGDSGA